MRPRHLLLLLSGLLACAPQEEPSEPLWLGPGVEAGPELVCEDPVEGIDRFTEEGVERGLDFIADVWPAPPGSAAGAGVVAHDVDADGDVDLLFGHVRGLPRVYLNDGDAHFAWTGQEIDTQPSGQLAAAWMTVDLDGDGLPALLISGPGGVSMFPNLGEGLFGEPVQIMADLGQETIVNSLGAGDVDGDGDLDLGVPQVQDWYMDQPDFGPGTPDLILTNTADGWVRSHELTPYDPPGYSVIAVFTDRDGDGDQDVFFPYDRVYQPMGTPPNAFYRNDGVDEDGFAILVNDAPEIGAALTMSGMGMDGADLNQDGVLDYCMSDTGPIVCLLSLDGGYVESEIDYEALGLPRSRFHRLLVSLETCLGAAGELAEAERIVERHIEDFVSACASGSLAVE